MSENDIQHQLSVATELVQHQQKSIKIITFSGKTRHNRCYIAETQNPNQIQQNKAQNYHPEISYLVVLSGDIPANYLPTISVGKHKVQTYFCSNHRQAATKEPQSRTGGTAYQVKLVLHGRWQRDTNVSVEQSRLQEREREKNELAEGGLIEACRENQEEERERNDIGEGTNKTKTLKNPILNRQTHNKTNTHKIPIPNHHVFEEEQWPYDPPHANPQSKKMGLFPFHPNLHFQSKVSVQTHGIGFLCKPNSSP